ncbi:MAG: hypothetical protein JXQ75_00240 [Phycisphaerae bacterium]|nr:hypothetical protein [Phycisphaerae bacterium]
MTEIITLSADEVVPDREAVFLSQGIPAGAVVREETLAVYAAAIDRFSEVAAPIGLLLEVSKRDFEVVFHGEGRNEPRTPVGDIFRHADHLALFAATLGGRISREIEDRFATNYFALGAVLDAVASVAADGLAKMAERRFLDMLLAAGRATLATTALCYSPGYCGWHMSGQKKLFEFLRPEQIGITLRDSFLMDPLKSVSGVVIAGDKRLHRFSASYPFCDRCKTHGCRDRS